MNPLLHNTPIDKWSTREKLSLASSVQTAGDQNWYSVSRQLKPFGEPNRPNDWFSQKSCAQQYGELLEKVDQPKRKRGEKKEDTAQNLIVRKLTLERISELKIEIESYQEQLRDLKKNISLLKNDNLSETDLRIIESQMIEQLNQKRKDEEEHQGWLKEREEKIQSMSRKKSTVTPKIAPRKDDNQTTPSTPTSLANKSTDEVQVAKTAEDGQSKAIKQENISAQETNEQPTPSVRTTRERSKELEKMQVVVISDDRPSTEKQTVSTSEQPAKPDKQPAAVKDKEATSKAAAEKTEVAKATTVKMEVDEVAEKSREEKDEARSVEMKEDGREETADRIREESIAFNKRKRTSTSISNVSTSNVVQQSPAQPPPQTPPATQTRRSGRISKPLMRPALTPTTPKPESVEQQAKRTQIDESNIIAPVNASQLLLNTDDSTKDSTTSDVTDTYTSPNSPASSILNVDGNTDPEQLREQKEFKAWRRSIQLLLKQAMTHKFSSLFMSPVTDDEANGYSTVVHKPMDLTTIRKKCDSGIYRTTAEFQRDIMLMFQNAIMYNSVKHEVHQMTLEMQKEILEAIEDFVTEQKAAKEQQATPTPAPKETPAAAATSSVSSSSRRKSRTLS